MRRLTLHPDTFKEIDEAATFYDQRAAGLGMRFLRAIDSGLDSIRQTPERFAILRGQRRRFLVRDFPYRIVYRSTSEEIRILAVAHTSRRPLYWLGRK